MVRKDLSYTKNKPTVDVSDTEICESERKVVERLKFLKSTLKEILNNYEKQK